MILNEEEIKARDERIKAAAEKKRKILMLSDAGRLEIQKTLREMNVRVRGLFGRLYNGKPLTATQFYQIS